MFTEQLLGWKHWTDSIEPGTDHSFGKTHTEQEITSAMSISSEKFIILWNHETEVPGPVWQSRKTKGMSKNYPSIKKWDEGGAEHSLWREKKVWKLCKKKEHVTHLR